MTSLLIQADELLRVAVSILEMSGSNPVEAGGVADHLVEANLRGHDSHGVGLLPTYMKDLADGHLRPNTHARLLSDEGVIGTFDGGRGYGHVVVKEAMSWAISKARDSGVAVFSVRDTYHAARLGSYGERAADRGLVSLLFANVFAGTQIVAPWGGTDGRLHTNPVCISIPSTPPRPHFVLDFATSRIAMGKVRVALDEQRQLPFGFLLDFEGHPTQEPAALFESPMGALLPFGEHKGSGLAVMCELLAGALTGGLVNQSMRPSREGLLNSVFGIVIDPARFGDVGEFNRRADAVVSHVKASPPASRDQPVLVAGEPEQITRGRRSAEGVPINLKTWNDIKALAVHE